MPNRSGVSSRDYSPRGDLSPSSSSGYGIYDSLFNANPYGNLTYNRSAFQDILSGLGFRTGADAFDEQAQINSAEWKARIFEMMFQNEYNSPAAQAQRMRDAGLNPDLLGLSEVSDAASSAPDPNGMNVEQDDDFVKAASAIGGFAKFTVSAFQAGLNLYHSVASVRNLKQSLNSIKLDNASKAMSVVDAAIVGSVPLSAFDSNDPQALEKYHNIFDWSAYGVEGDLASQLSGVARDRLGSLKNNVELRNMVYQRGKQASDLNQDILSGTLSPSEGFMSSDTTFNIWLDAMSVAARDFMKLKAQNDLRQEGEVRPLDITNQEVAAGIESERLNTLDASGYGAIQADGQVLSGQALNFSAETDKIINSAKARMMRNLKVAADTGDEMAKVTLMAMALQDFAQFEFSGNLDFNVFKGLANIATDVFGNKSSSQRTHKGDRSRGFGFGFDFDVRTK